MKTFIKSLLMVCLLSPLYCLAEVAVIVHPANSAELDSSKLSRIYLGKLKKFSTGDPVIPLNLESGATRANFETKVLNKQASQLKAYWSKLLFTGKGVPPKELSSDAEVIDLVSKNPNVIGYIDAAAVTSDVKVIATY